MAAVIKQQTEGRITSTILDPQKSGRIDLANVKILFPQKRCFNKEEKCPINQLPIFDQSLSEHRPTAAPSLMNPSQGRRSHIYL